MTQEHGNEEATNSLPGADKETLSTLRSTWQAQGRTSADLDEACGNNNICKSMQGVGFQGLKEDVGMPADAHSVGASNLSAAWKKKLKHEGKLSEGTSVRELIFGSADPDE
jgi:hypothetical protein